MRLLLNTLLPLLPRRVYAHLDAYAVPALADAYDIESHGGHYKMGLLDVARTATTDNRAVVPLTADDLPELAALYGAAYPGNWFVARMVEAGFYYGLRREGTLVSAAGVHVCSRRYGVAALGNIATLPEWRSRGFARTVTAALCRGLLDAGIRHIGLNVRADNPAALACYEGLGFRRVGEYGEYMLELKGA
jgi:predicted GNAT family acetyltransferase